MVMVSTLLTPSSCDVLIVGAGIVGLAHATEALRRGLSVTIIDRDEHAVGASVRNFGHCCVTAQSGDLFDLAQVARERWLHFAERAGFFSTASGALVIARSAEEVAVLEELSASREPGQVALLGALEARERVSAGPDSAVIGGALLRDDLRVDPREAVRSLAAWLAAQAGVTILWRTTFLGANAGRAETSRGRIQAERIIICVGHDLDYLYPAVAEEHGMERCGLHMTRIAALRGLRIDPAVLTGTSMLRYPAFTETSAAIALRKRIAETAPELIDIGANVMFTQRPDGTIIAGDSHQYAVTMDPFQLEKTTELLLAQVGEVLGIGRPRVIERWQGVYASSPQHPYLVEEITPDVTAVSVTSGVGMTISFGLAAKVFAARD